jgi:N-acetylneuraminic acid mutarotase
LAPAHFAVSAQLEVARLDAGTNAAYTTHAVVFFESAVADYQSLEAGLAADTDAVVLDSSGDGLLEMAAFLASRHDLTAVGVVAHGAPGKITLGTAVLTGQNVAAYAPQLAVVGQALAPAGELDLWSCDVAAGEGADLVQSIGARTGAKVAAADHLVGSATRGGSWDLNVRSKGALTQIPFADAALQDFDGVLDDFESAAPLATERGYQTATRLANGKVLIAGGQNNTGYLASAELYDPATDIWSSAGSMASARFLHTATLLANGKVLVVGGFGVGGFLASAELYDPATNSWSSAGTLNTPRDLHTATLLASGQVLITGGFNSGVLSSAELYDPGKNIWTVAGSLNTGREQHTATLLASGKVLVTGGLDANSTAVASAELYDPAANTWSAAGRMSAPRYFQSATLLANGKVLVAGGVGNNFDSLNSAELYDPANNNWAAAASLATARDQHTATLLESGKVLVVGGNGNSTLATAELYDAVQNSWAAAPTMDTARADHTATLLSNGEVLVAAGLGAGGWLKSAELYNPATTAGLQLQLSVLGGNTVVANTSFLVTAQVVDDTGNPVTNYSGATTVTLTPTPADPAGAWPVTGTLSKAGFGFFQANLKTTGTFIVTATAGSLKGSSSPITVTPGPAAFFKVTVPAIALTGAASNVTVTALDPFGNTATGYKGQVHFSSSDPKAVLPADATLTGGVGVFKVTLNTGGSQTITATDAVFASPLTITGTSSPITTRGLTVTTFTTTATGFTATFNKPFAPGAIALYGPGTHLVPSVTLVGAANGPISGSLILDPSNMSLTFNATANFLLLANNSTAPVLPDDTYTATLVSASGASGFMDALGAGLDGTNSGGHADYTTTFTTHYFANKTPVLSIPDFARGPDAAHAINVPNDVSHGIPITLYEAAGATDVTFVLNYNPALLSVTGASSADATDTSSSFALVGNPTIIDATHAVASFHFQSANAQTGTAILGDIQATVPNSAAANYKAKELLQLGSIRATGAIVTVVAANGIHINAYFGDVSGNGSIDGLDVATALTVARGDATGFAAYQLLDPAVVGDIASDFSVDAGAVSDLAAFTVHLPVPPLPAPPGGLTITPVGADPTLSLGPVQGQADTEMGRQGDGEKGRKEQPSPVLPVSSSPLLSFTVPVLLDNPHPEGSTGMTEAVLALTYDPAVLSVSPDDIKLGSIPAHGTGWQLVVAVDPVNGRIGIQLFSTTPITTDEGGSLVTIDFQIAFRGRRRISGSRVSSTPLSRPTVQLVDRVVVDGQEFVTQIADTQGQLVLSTTDDRRLAL